MRRRLGGVIESVYNTPSRGGRDGNGPGQPLLRKLTAARTSLNDKRKLRHQNLLLIDSPQLHETVLKHSRSRFSVDAKSSRDRPSTSWIRPTTQEIAMTAIPKALSNVIPAISPDFDILKTVAVFCGVGLCVSLILASYGLDLSAGFF
jgi:hypothetical protein